MKFMINNRLNQPPNDEIAALLPAEQARVAELMAQGTLLSLYVAADYSGVWLICQGESPEMVQTAIESLPLSRFARSEITPLADLG